MAENFPGPFCHLNQISKTDLENGKVLEYVQPLPNGIVLEINSYFEKIGRNSHDLFNVVVQLDPAFKVITAKYLKTKLSRICDKKKQFTSKKEVHGVKKVKALLNAVFFPPVAQSKTKIK